jgi:hypothetical protein
MNFISAKYLYDMEGVNKTHIQLELGNDKFKHIPIDEANTDYQAIQEWVAIEGNEIIDNGGGE